MRIATLLVAFLFLAGDVNAQNSAFENKILDTISKLSCVVQRNDHVKKATNDKRYLSIVIYVKPIKNIPYYWVKVWEDNGYNYVTHFNFHVYPTPFTIKLFNPESETEEDISFVKP